MSMLQTLDANELATVSGGESLPPITPIKLKDVRAQDAYGNTMDHWDWMDYIRNGGDPFDFPGGKGN